MNNPELKVKYPEASPKFGHYFSKVIFEKITEYLIQKVSIRTNGAAGPSKYDPDHWWRTIWWNVFGDHHLELQSEIKAISEWNRTTVPNNKLPVVRPIAIGEMLRRVMRKAVILESCQERYYISSRSTTSLFWSSLLT